jgi:hypothetical protein
MQPLLTQFHLPFEAFGYGPVEQIPAAYVLRYISARLFRAMLFSPVVNRTSFGWPRGFTRGFGDLWERVAAAFDVRLNARVRRIDRDPAIAITWSEQGKPAIREEFDLLVVACPPLATSSFLNWTATEARLFNKIRTLPYSVTICESSDIAPGIYFTAEPCEAGRLIQFWKPAAGPGPCAFYTCPPPGMSAAEILSNIREDLPRLSPGATAGEMLIHEDWAYFPHVDPQAFAEGYYDDFEAMQGENSTWYSGSLLAFESVENVVAYSEQLVERMIWRN